MRSSLEWARIDGEGQDGLEAWRTRALADRDVIYVYLDGFALRLRSAGKVVSVPVLGVVGVLPDGREHLLALELCGGESFEAWKGPSMISPLGASEPRCSASSTAIRGYGARSGSCGPGPRSNAAASTNCATSNVKLRSTRSRTFATTTIT
ncbi:MAG: transposase [Candidatus Rokubacteria bacterium]|nr:transposase [Candidatus Rokubacteria bacterium]